MEELRFSASVEMCEMDSFQTMFMVACKGLRNLATYYLDTHFASSVGIAAGPDDLDSKTITASCLQVCS